MDDLLGYEGIYKIDEFGNIFDIHGNPRRYYITNKGYKMIDLSKNGIKKSELIHRLVAKQYIPNPENLPIVLHKDNQKLNTHYLNLKWGTYSENNSQAIRDGLNKIPRPDTRKYYELYNDFDSIVCCGAREVINHIGYGSDSVVRNLLFRGDKINQGPYKGYKLRKLNIIRPIRFVN